MSVRMVLPWSSLLFLIAFSLAGCNPNPPPPSSNNAPVSTGSAPINTKRPIGVSILTFDNDFFKIIADNITEEVEKEGYKTIIVAGEKDVAKQQRQIEDFISQGCSAIVLCPCDEVAIGPAIQKANTAGIPVFTADLACTAPNAKVVSHIATDNYSGGKLAGVAMIEAVGESGGKVVILDYKTAESCKLRVKGFKEVIAKHNAEKPERQIEIVSELPGEGALERGSQATDDALQAHPDLVGIFAINDPSALGAYSAVQRAKKTDQVKIIGFDGQKSGKEAIRDGKIYADPIQYPDRIGKLTARSILDYFAGKEPPPEQLLATELYRQADGQKDESLNK